ncbi:universal stress protein [Pseudomonas sp. CDFA 602]|uniref:universal stress protein n=1 Tax=Pseudomonas californiensis TaxID=2829823 RepID=UPI001E5F2FB0|nr:universal stress protein [Pseudomonas californiensis]MCD5996915.1 universal stress protein [Pseudomonas californiensis]MCD6002488.1 universal stress protein [Pseudomonas californiensis]
MFKKILVAIDGSEQSWAVLDLAKELAGPSNDAHLRLICVIDPAYALPEGDSLFANEQYPAAAHEQHQGQALMKEALLQLQVSGIVCSAETLAGNDPAVAICEEARRMDSDMLVIGHRHMSFFGRLKEPSVTSKVLELSPCPVVVKGQEH